MRILLLLILGSLFAVMIGNVDAEETTAPKELAFEIIVNKIEISPARVLEFPDGQIWVSHNSLLSWRIIEPKTKPYQFRGENYFSLNSIPDLLYTINEAEQKLEITAKPNAFSSSVIGGENIPILSQTNPLLGMFFNYDFLEQHTSTSTGIGNEKSKSNQLNGTFEDGIFSRLGVLTTNFFGTRLGQSNHFVRLESTFTHDFISHLSSYRMGDAITNGGSWGRPVRFGGAQWATNFATQPGFISFPSPSIYGETALPSTVDIYINNNFRASKDVPAGPFQIRNLPLVTGQGLVQLTVRDVLGREQVITQPYYVTPSLLKKGLSEFSYEGGSVRNNFGVESNSYGPSFFSLTHRLGFTNSLTGELHSELLKDTQNVGIGSAILIPFTGTLSGSYARSHNSKNLNGSQSTIGFNRQSTFSFGGNLQYLSEHFSQLGQIAGGVFIRRIASAFLGISPFGSDSLAFNVVNQKNWGLPTSQIETINYTFSPLRNLSATIFGSKITGASSSNIYGINLSTYLGNRTSGNISTTHQSGMDQDTTMQIQRSLPEGPGIGYRVLADRGSRERGEASVEAQTTVGNYTAEASRLQEKQNRQNGTNSFRVGANGGLIFLGEGIFASRTVSDSFALAKVDNYKDVTVYKEHQPVGKTNSNGTFLIPKLRPYDINHIGIEQADLPINAQVETLDLEVVPYYRSGVLADFNVKSQKVALIKVILEDGSFLPIGATVILKDQEFPVASNGEAFVTNMDQENKMKANWKEQSCEFEVSVPKDAGPLPVLGPFLCKGVQP